MFFPLFSTFFYLSASHPPFFGIPPFYFFICFLGFSQCFIVIVVAPVVALAVLSNLCAIYLHLINTRLTFV